MKIVTVLGARPQFIKAAVLSRVISETDGVEEIIIHTGQHFDENMSEIFFEQMQIPRPKYNLDINSLGHGAMTGMMLTKIEEILLEEKPDWLVVYGDTNSTLAGALAASKLHIKVAHIEAGLRSFNMRMPEEINRILTDRISNLLFSPSKSAIKLLADEGITTKGEVGVHYVGDIMYDGLLHFSQKATQPSAVTEVKFILATLHRAENTDDPQRLKNLVEALNEIHSKVPVVLPLHPRTKKKLEEQGLSLNIKLIDPVGYLEMLWLINNCSFVMTDSGGLQKEAYFCEKYCITMRDETEWIELVEENVNTLCGANKDKILSNANKIIDGVEINFPKNIYGDGTCGKQILTHIMNY